MKKRPAVLLLFTALLSLGMAFCSQAEEKAITSIPLSFSWDQVPRGGELVGTITASSSSTQFVVEGADYVKDDDTWIFGEQPVVEVALSAEPDNRFTGTFKSYFSLSGCNAQYQSARVEKDGNGLTLFVTLSKIDGNLPKVESVNWNGTRAIWDEVPGSKGYEATLYRDNRLVATVSTEEAACDFEPYIHFPGRYTFSVRATGTYSTQNGPWTADQEGMTLTREDAWLMDSGSWQQSGSKWKYVYGNGDAVTGDWRRIGEDWYYFDASGYMVSGCYVKAAAENRYYWIGEDGKWDTQWDTDTPNRAKYTVYS